MGRVRFVLFIVAMTVVQFGLSAACRRAETPSQPPSKATTQPADQGLDEARKLAQETARPATEQPQLPPGHMPIDTMQTPPAEQPASGVLQYAAPEAWKKEKPSSGMRADQYSLPAADADTADGELAVFYSGPSGMGGLDANIDRWRGQFSTPDDQPVLDADFARSSKEVNGLKVTLVEVSGRYSAGMMAFGGTAPPPQDNYRLLGAIVETPAGPWYFKATGPAATMQHHRDAFLKFVETMQFK